MSYQFPQKQAPRRKSGGGMFFLILLGVGAFLIFSRMGNGPADNGAGQQQPIPRGSSAPLEDDYASQREAVFGPDEPESKVGKRMPTTGGTGAADGWDIKDVTTKKNNEFNPSAKPNSSKTQKGDWAIEDVDRKPSNDGQFKFNNSQSLKAPVEAPGKGDWEIQDITPKTNAKTQKGDWTIEETNAIEN